MSQEVLKISESYLSKIFSKISKDDSKLVELIDELERYDDRASMILLGRSQECLSRLRDGSISDIRCKCGLELEAPQSTEPKEFSCPNCNSEFWFPAKFCGALIPRFASDTTLCLDFGTSSLKAALRKTYKSEAVSLNLGLQANAEGLYNDDQSAIPSAIFISKTNNLIYFGQDALLRGQRGESYELFEISPKKWLTELTSVELNQHIVGGVSRKNLLSGLLSIALESAMAQGSFDIQELLAMDLRVSHPVWPNAKTAEELNATLKEIADEAVNLTYLRTAPSSEPIKNIDEFEKRLRTSLIDHCSSKVDVEEPIAAAIELFDNASNSREVCVIIDVGAGTTDIGLFQSVTPDNQANLKRKLISLKSPISIYLAGDFIDLELIDAINKASLVALNPSQLGDIKSRRRQIKETLFNSGSVTEYGVSIQLDDLIKRDGITLFCKTIKEAFIGRILDSKETIYTLFKTTNNPIQKIDVIFAGGGANIGFLNSVIRNTEIDIHGSKIPISLRKPATAKYKNLKAPIERLAVSLGGTLDDQEWPETKMKDSPVGDSMGYKTPLYTQNP